MLTEANERGEKGDPDLHLDDLLEWGDRLSLAVLPDLDSAGRTRRWLFCAG